MGKANVISSGLLGRDFFAVLVIVANSFSWYFPLYVLFQNFLESSVNFSTLLIALGVHYVGSVIFAFVGSILVKSFSSRRTFLSLWMLLGVASSAMLLALDVNNVVNLLVVSLLLGTSLGLGFPSCLAFFGDNCLEENRGRFGGITYFISSLCMLLIGLLTNAASFATGVLILAFWRGLGLVLFILASPRQGNRKGAADVPYKLPITDKPLMLYLIPWIMFCLVNFSEFPIVTNFFGTDFTLFIVAAEYGIGGFSALIGGWFADSVGRKRIVILGFMVIGIGYAVLGLFSNSVLSWYMYIVLDGIAWGIFSLMFYLVIWADLAKARLKEKFYLVGVLPFIVSSYVRILLTPYARSTPISVAFSLASFFLFLAVLPLLYAPETLPEKEIEKKRLQKYLKDVEKVKKKYEKR